MDDYNNMNQNQIGGPNPPQGGMGLSITSMVIGILGLLICCVFPPVSLVGGIVGLVLGIMSVKKGNAGKGMAIAGIVLSIITLVLAIGTMALGGAILSSFDLNELENLSNELNNY